MALIAPDVLLTSLPLIAQGKVRDCYAIGEDRLLMVTSDRVSAFDVVMRQTIPDKGRILNQLSLFWFGRFAGMVDNHLTQACVEEFVTPEEMFYLAGRSVVVKRLQPIPVEVVIRGYLCGSAWADYQASGEVCGLPLPSGLPFGAKLPQPICTPAAKAAVGAHDENISFRRMENLIGASLAAALRAYSLELYKVAAGYAATRGLLMADTKFEFGLDAQNRVHLMDEVCTPDASRFWLTDSYSPGIAPPALDKQALRDYLQASSWDKTPPPPDLPDAVIDQTRLAYLEVFTRLTGSSLASGGMQ